MKHFLLFAFKIHFIYYRDMITKKTPTIFIRVLVENSQRCNKIQRQAKIEIQNVLVDLMAEYPFQEISTKMICAYCINR